MRAEGFLPPDELLQWHFEKPLIVLEHAYSTRTHLARNAREFGEALSTRKAHYCDKRAAITSKSYSLSW